MNSGHICTAPDHVLVWPEVKDEFVGHLIESIREFDGDDPQKSPDYGRVINRRNFDRLVGLIGSGRSPPEARPTRPNSTLRRPYWWMFRSIHPSCGRKCSSQFRPLQIQSVEAVIKWVNERPSPLGLYVFAEDADVVERILNATSSGDAEVNDCAIHPLVPELPFGGVGNSGGWANITAGGDLRRSPMPRHPLSQRQTGSRRALPTLHKTHLSAADHQRTDTVIRGKADAADHASESRLLKTCVRPPSISQPCSSRASRGPPAELSTNDVAFMLVQRVLRDHMNIDERGRGHCSKSKGAHGHNLAAGTCGRECVRDYTERFE